MAMARGALLHRVIGAFALAAMLHAGALAQPNPLQPPPPTSEPTSHCR
jgi:hypothetical protein